MQKIIFFLWFIITTNNDPKDNQRQVKNLVKWLALMRSFIRLKGEKNSVFYDQILH